MRTLKWKKRVGEQYIYVHCLMGAYRKNDRFTFSRRALNELQGGEEKKN